MNLDIIYDFLVPGIAYLENKARKFVPGLSADLQNLNGDIFLLFWNGPDTGKPDWRVHLFNSWEIEDGSYRESFGFRSANAFDAYVMKCRAVCKPPVIMPSGSMHWIRLSKAPTLAERGPFAWKWFWRDSINRQLWERSAGDTITPEEAWASGYRYHCPVLCADGSAP